ncbi:SDR family NAD(P)-dependent oxidoreductase [Aeoliella mucimassa]|uniref:3-oxoacyl-[acyl-carrier-protein] reductase FabG n=1 Tax=Aeoliella mucimassa TaxID=2527972 RepID=A0A518AQ74_9BACT|nr:SDR family oxidoreductase [Aeoliella mucimassa]QDU56872.1 3-oxoacyl-[acyl-carrier-protein] reductase FabG [Aeoliella mucimassa]
MSKPTEPTSPFDLAGKTALVTGGSGYLGLAFCNSLAAAGARVVVGSRSESRAQQVADALQNRSGVEHLGVALDYRDDQAIEQGFSDAISRAGAIDVLVNNGHILDARDWTTVDGPGFDQQMRNATGYFLLARLFRDAAVAKQMPGSIVMLGSMYGRVASYPEVYDGIGPASSVAYQCLKGGVAQMVRHLSVYWAKDRIRVNALSPGPFPNPEGAPAELVARLEQKSPMGRIGRAEEIGGPLVFLCSDASSYVTGHNLMVDGGWTAW